MSYLEALDRELGAVGIRGRRRSRIVAEFADHLGCAPNAELGEPTQVARQFADELGTALARRAAFAVFAALAVAGALFAAAWLAQQGAVVRSLNAGPSRLGDFAGVVVAVAPQVAFVAGLLGALRAWQRRGSAVIPRREAVILLRRAGLGLLAGLASMGGLALMAFTLRNTLPGWWLVLAWSASGVGAAALLAAGPVTFAAAPVRPVTEGEAGDVFEDLGPLAPAWLTGHPWRFAFAVAAGLAALVTLAGVAQSDPFDGALRGLLDGAACLVGFGVLGRYLGLRPQ